MSRPSSWLGGGQCRLRPAVHRPARNAVATLPIGYADGIRRALSDNCDVIVGGRKYPIVGTVSMDNVTIDLGPEPTVSIGDPATIIGGDGGSGRRRRSWRGGSGRSTTRSCAASPAACHGNTTATERRLTDPLAVLARVDGDAWLVGGALRDRLRGVASSDYDIALTGNPEQVARWLGRHAGGHPFRLSEGFGVWRVASHARDWQVDLIPLAGATIEEDLAQRDFTINAIAEALSGGPLIDPFGGVEDLDARRLRMVGPEVFERDPLRAIRLARIACELDFVVDPATSRAALANAAALGAVAPERVFNELKRILSWTARPAGSR